MSLTGQQRKSRLSTGLHWAAEFANRLNAALDIISSRSNDVLRDGIAVFPQRGHLAVGRLIKGGIARLAKLDLHQPSGFVAGFLS
jgi:hypothetical protein